MCNSIENQIFPDGKLLNAKMKSGASFTWQRILARVKTFNSVCIWHVGEGTLINIWDDAWVSTSPNGKLITSKKKKSSGCGLWSY